MVDDIGATPLYIAFANYKGSDIKIIEKLCTKNADFSIKHASTAQTCIDMVFYNVEPPLDLIQHVFEKDLIKYGTKPHEFYFKQLLSKRVMPSIDLINYFCANSNLNPDYRFDDHQSLLHCILLSNSDKNESGDATAAKLIEYFIQKHSGLD